MLRPRPRPPGRARAVGSASSQLSCVQGCRAMLGNLARVTNQRGTTLSLVGDEWAVLTGIDSLRTCEHRSSSKCQIAYFEASDEIYARTLSAHLVSSAPGAPAIYSHNEPTSKGSARRSPARAASILSQYRTSQASGPSRTSAGTPDTRLHACRRVGTLYCGPRVTVRSSREECTAVSPARGCVAYTLQ